MKVDQIFNLASPASPRSYARLPLETLRVGSAGTLNSLELARRNEAVYFLASTSEVYGDPEESPQKESYWGNVNPVGARSVYDEAKRFAEAATVAYGRKYGISTRIGRIFNTYGPRMDEHDGRLVPNLITNVLSGTCPIIYGDGQQTRSLCYVSDTVSGIVTVAESCSAVPTNIGADEELRVVDIARIVLDLIQGPTPKIVHGPAVEDDPRRRRPDISRIKSLGWQPQVDLRAGLTQTIAWMRSERLTTPKLAGA